jgi:DNA invertase Pin-like site-specific DNA recombinase
LLNDATARKINMVAAWSVDRLGRSLQHLVGFLNELQALNCHLLGGTGMVKIGKALGVGTGLVQRVLAEQARPFDVGVVEAYTPQ